MANKPKQSAVTTPDRYFGEMGTLYNPFVPYDTVRSTDAALWRYISLKQPIITDCINTLIMRVQALPWTIRAIDADETDELKDEIERHKKIVLDFGGLGYLNGTDLVIQDYYMTPFGGAVEPVKYSDGRLFKIVRVDSATLFPTLNPLFPVVQRVGGREPIPFRDDELVRVYSPRPELERTGWGFCAAEKVYLAVELLSRGDRYYAQMLLDTPEAGLLDLGDMSKDSAEKWLDSFRNLMSGIDAFKIPVIYQHTTPAKWIPFGRPPMEMMFDQITFKYAQLVCAAFGITTSDIGLRSSSGGSLSGEIRQERTSRSTGFASIKAKLTEFYNRMLPENLEFAFIDTDDELLISKGRARSANAVAGRNLIEAGTLTPIEWRKQLVADGLITIPLTEEPDEEAFEILKEIDGTADQLELQKEQLDVQKKLQKQQAPGVGANQGGKGLNKQRNVRGGKLETVQGKDTVPASSGGQGEIKSGIIEYFGKHFDNVLDRTTDTRVRKLVKMAIRSVYGALQVAATTQQDYEVWKSKYIEEIFSDDKTIESQLKLFSNAVVNDEFWLEGFDASELADILEEIYLSKLIEAAREHQRREYENGTVNSPDLEIIPKSDVDLFEYAEKLINLINSTNGDYYKRLAFASVIEISDEYKQLFSDTSTLENLLENDEFINRAKDVFIENLRAILAKRVVLIEEVETNKISAKSAEEYQKGLENGD